MEPELELEVGLAVRAFRLGGLDGTVMLTELAAVMGGEGFRCWSAARLSLEEVR